MDKELFPGYNRGECRGDYKYFDFNKKTITDIRMCNKCKVSDACLTYALTNERWGVWSNTTEDDRVLLRAEMGIPTPPLAGNFAPLGPVNVFINRHRSAQRMRDMKYRKFEQIGSK